MERLSSRGLRNVQAIMPKMPASILEAKEEGDMVDFSGAENWVMRSQITQLCRDAVDTGLEPKHLCWPLGFYGMPKLIDAMTCFLNDHLQPHIPVRPNELIVTPGANSSVQSLMWNICESGDGVLVPAPFFYGFSIHCLIRPNVQIVEAVPANLADAMNESIVDSLDKAYEGSQIPIKALLISNPNNPIGRPWSRKVLESMYRFCQRRNIHFISDEVFAVTTFDSQDEAASTPFTSLLALDAERLGCDAWRTHVLFSASKAFGMSGLRLGFACTRAGPDFRNGLALAAMQEVSVMSSLLVLHILTSPSLSSILEQSSQILAARYARITSALKKLKVPFVPCNAALSLLVRVAPDARSWEDEGTTIAALKEAGVFVSGGRGYRMPEIGWARVTFAQEEDVLEEGIRRMSTVLGSAGHASAADDIANHLLETKI